MSSPQMSKVLALFEVKTTPKKPEAPRRKYARSFDGNTPIRQLCTNLERDMANKHSAP